MKPKFRFIFSTTFILVVSLLFLHFALAQETNQTQITSEENQTTNETVITEPDLALSLEDSRILTTEEARVEITIDSPDTLITKIKIEWDDGNEKIISPNRKGFYSFEESNSYETAGSYDIQILVEFDNWSNKSVSRSITVESPPQNNDEDEDENEEETNQTDEKPTIEMIYPQKDTTLEVTKVTLRFKPNDDKDLKNCTFFIYKGDSTLEFSQDFSNPEENKELSVTLSDFEDLEYTWKVTCTDSKPQTTTSSQKFKVTTERFKKEQEILAISDLAQNFLDLEKDLDPRERQIIEILKIKEDVVLYKKRIEQIRQMVSLDFKSISDAYDKETKKKEAYEELSKITQSIPLNFKTLESEEFMINSKITDLKEITDIYVTEKNMDLSERRKRILAKKNEEIQTKASVTTSLDQVEIEYNDTKTYVTLVKKTVKISDPSLTHVIEIFPEDIAEKNITFLTKVEKLGENSYEASLEGDQKEIVYYFNEKISSSTIKESQTILFEKFPTDEFTLVGMSILGVDVHKYRVPGFIIIIFAVALVGTFTITKLHRRKSEDLKEISVLIKNGFQAVQRDELEDAKEIYLEIKEAYSALDQEDKAAIFKKVLKLGEEIDKTDMMELIKEYKLAKRKKAPESEVLYDKIKMKYTKLPKKFQKEIEQKILRQR